MLVKSEVVVEVKKEENTYRFMMPVMSSYKDAYDAAVDCANTIVEMSKKAQEAAEARQKESEVAPEPVVEEPKKDE